MNLVIRKALCTSTFVLAAAAAAGATAAPVNCAKPSDRGEAGACAAAAQGVTELRQYIWRKRAVYMLYIHDFDHAVAPYAAIEQPKVAGLRG